MRQRNPGFSVRVYYDICQKEALIDCLVAGRKGDRENMLALTLNGPVNAKGKICNRLNSMLSKEKLLNLMKSSRKLK